MRFRTGMMDGRKRASMSRGGRAVSEKQIDGDDAQGHGRMSGRESDVSEQPPIDDDSEGRARLDHDQSDEDVEGHVWPPKPIVP